VKKHAAWLIATALVAVAVFLAFRPLQAWWLDDAGNRALLRGDGQTAVAWFASAVQREPDWSFLHEDLGRGVLSTDPERALAEFERANCGSACVAEEGDALAALGRTSDAIDRYIEARAVAKVDAIAAQLVAAKRYDAALAIESKLVARLHDDFVDRADRAAAYAQIGKIEIVAATQAGAGAAARRHAQDGLVALARASDLAPLNEDYLLSDGFAQMRFGSAEQARRIFERLLQIDPSQQDAQRALRMLSAANPPRTTSP
jgi:tetratricopeptide (TPR) repeat protein